METSRTDSRLCSYIIFAHRSVSVEKAVVCAQFVLFNQIPGVDLARATLSSESDSEEDKRALASLGRAQVREVLPAKAWKLYCYIFSSHDIYDVPLLLFDSAIL